MADPNEQQPRWLTIVYYGIVALYCAWVLSLPVLPTQDGPLHLYYVNVMRHLLAHDNALYAQHYFIGRYVPPYSLYYYGLIALGHITTLENADKLFACLFFLIFAAGVRSLLRAVTGRRANLASFLALPVLLNWPLLMGFLNYSLATGMACFALAAWARNRVAPGAAKRALFLGIVLLILLTHPVPWIFVEAFVFFELAFRPTQGESLHSRSWLLDAATAFTGALGFFFLRSFRNVAVAGEVPAPEAGSFVHRAITHSKQYVAQHGLAIFADMHRPVTLLYRALLTVILASMIAVAVWSFRTQWKGRRSTMQTAWCVFALAFLLLLPFIPPTLNGSAYFAQRLLTPLYLSLLVASAPRLSAGRVATTMAAASACFALLTLALAQSQITPVARAVASVAQLPSLPAQQSVLLADPASRITPGLAFAPFEWAGAAYPRRQNGLLYNTAWLELAIIPVKLTPQGQAALDAKFFPEPASDGHMEFRSQGDRRFALGRAGTVLQPKSGGQDMQQGACAQTVAWLLCPTR